MPRTLDSLCSSLSPLPPPARVLSPALFERGLFFSCEGKRGTLDARGTTDPHRHFFRNGGPDRSVWKAALCGGSWPGHHRTGFRAVRGGPEDDVHLPSALASVKKRPSIGRSRPRRTSPNLDPPLSDFDEKSSFPESSRRALQATLGGVSQGRRGLEKRSSSHRLSP